MPQQIESRFSARAAIGISLGGLASSTSGVGRQGSIVDNTSDGYQRVYVFYKIKQGTSPTGNRGVNFHLIRDDGDGSAPVRDDGAGASDAAFTAVSARLVKSAMNKPSPATGDLIQGSFAVDNPGPKWTVAVSHDTGVNLDATNGNHELWYVGERPEIQDAP